MLRRIVTTVLAIALVCISGGTAAFAHNPTSPGASEGAAHTPADSSPESKKEAAPGGKLKGDFSRLVADAREGKVGTTVQPRQQPAQSNGLSKRTKITIAVVVAAVVITAVVIASKTNDWQDGPGIRIF